MIHPVQEAQTHQLQFAFLFKQTILINNNILDIIIIIYISRSHNTAQTRLLHIIINCGKNMHNPQIRSLIFVIKSHNITCIVINTESVYINTFVNQFLSGQWNTCNSCNLSWQIFTGWTRVSNWNLMFFSTMSNSNFVHG